MAQLLGYLLLLAIVAGLISVGLRGFSAQGLPWTRTRKLTGATAKVVGMCCITLGVAGSGLGIYDAIVVYGPKRQDAAANPGNHPPPKPPSLEKAKQQAKPLEGLIAYWNFDENDGAEVRDLSGRGHHATLHGGKRVEGVKGKAIRLSGKGDFIDYGDSADFNFPASASFTLSGWVKTSSSFGTILAQSDSQKGRSKLRVGLAAGALDVYLRGLDEDGPGWSALRTSFNDDKWHHFAFARGAADKKVLYVDGKNEGLGFGIERPPSAISTDKRFIGLDYFEAKQADSVHPFFFGSVDEFCFFNRALTPNEVGRLASMDASALPLPPDMKKETQTQP